MLQQSNMHAMLSINLAFPESCSQVDRQLVHKQTDKRYRKQYTVDLLVYIPELTRVIIKNKKIDLLIFQECSPPETGRQYDFKNL